MGTLRAFNLIELKEKYKLNCLVETGTFKGDGVQAGIDAGFDKIHSCDIDVDFYHNAVIKFKSISNVFLYNLNSESFLDNVQYLISKYNVLFWLDAHLPDIKNAEKRLIYPLQTELSILKSKRDISGDIFIIDDLRIYEEGNYGHGNYTDRDKSMNSNFIYNILSFTHDIIKDYRHEGYLLCVPKEIA